MTITAKIHQICKELVIPDKYKIVADDVLQNMRKDQINTLSSYELVFYSPNESETIHQIDQRVTKIFILPFIAPAFFINFNQNKQDL
jgi:hypothetical protein